IHPAPPAAGRRRKRIGSLPGRRRPFPGGRPDPRRWAGMIEAIILCGGKGERLRPGISDRPKSLAEVGGRPFLEWLVLALANQGLHRIVLATGFMGDAIEAAMGDGQRFNVELVYSHETDPRGAGGAGA